MVALIQTMNKMFIILDQTMVHIAISAFFFHVATTTVANSGKDVQIASIVSQIIVSEMSKYFAISIAQFTIHLHQIVSHANQSKIYSIDLVVDVLFLIHSTAISSFISSGSCFFSFHV